MHLHAIKVCWLLPEWNSSSCWNSRFNENSMIQPANQELERTNSADLMTPFALAGAPCGNLGLGSWHVQFMFRDLPMKSLASAYIKYTDDMSSLAFPTASFHLQWTTGLLETELMGNEMHYHFSLVFPIFPNPGPIYISSVSGEVLGEDILTNAQPVLAAPYPDKSPKRLLLLPVRLAAEPRLRKIEETKLDGSKLRVWPKATAVTPQHFKACGNFWCVYAWLCEWKRGSGVESFDPQWTPWQNCTTSGGLECQN